MMDSHRDSNGTGSWKPSYEFCRCWVFFISVIILICGLVEFGLGLHMARFSDEVDATGLVTIVPHWNIARNAVVVLGVFFAVSGICGMGGVGRKAPWALALFILLSVAIIACSCVVAALILKMKTEAYDWLISADCKMEDGRIVEGCVLLVHQMFEFAIPNAIILLLGAGLLLLTLYCAGRYAYYLLNGDSEQTTHSRIGDCEKCDKLHMVRDVFPQASVYSYHRSGYYKERYPVCISDAGSMTSVFNEAQSIPRKNRLSIDMFNRAPLPSSISAAPGLTTSALNVRTPNINPSVCNASNVSIAPSYSNAEDEFNISSDYDPVDDIDAINCAHRTKMEMEDDTVEPDMYYGLVIPTKKAPTRSGKDVHNTYAVSPHSNTNRLADDLVYNTPDPQTVVKRRNDIVSMRNELREPNSDSPDRVPYVNEQDAVSPL